MMLQVDFKDRVSRDVLMARAMKYQTIRSGE